MGRHVFAVGGNVEASRFAGLRLGADPDRRLRGLGPDRRPGRLPGRELLRLRLLRRRHRLRAVRDRFGGGGRGQPDRREGERGRRHAGRAADRAHPPVHPHAALRPELRVDRHRLRDHRGGGARPGQRAPDRPAPGWPHQLEEPDEQASPYPRRWTLAVAAPPSLAACSRRRRARRRPSAAAASPGRAGRRQEDAQDRADREELDQPGVPGRAHGRGGGGAGAGRRNTASTSRSRG